MTQPTIPRQLERRARLEPEAGAERTVRGTLSTGAEVRRMFGTEVLVHDRAAIDLARAEPSGLPLLVNHDRQALPIGRVRNVSLEDGRLRGDFVFSTASEAAREAWALVDEGTVTDVSLSYEVRRHRNRSSDDGRELVEITRWAPLEASIVSLPLDPAAGLGRSHEDVPMDTDTDTTTPADGDAVTLERARVAELMELSRTFPRLELDPTEAIRDGISADAYRDHILARLASEAASPSDASRPQSRSLSIVPGDDRLERLERGISEAMDIRAGNLPGEEHERAMGNEFAGYPLTELARAWYRATGQDVQGAGASDLAGRVLSRAIDPGTAVATTATFPALLENVLNKALFRGFDSAPQVWSRLFGQDSAPNFQPGTRPNLSQFSDLEVVAENAQIQDGTLADKKEAFQIQTYAKKYSITREALVNDALGALATTAARMGEAANRTVDRTGFAFLESNPLMTEDGNALFFARTVSNIDTTVDKTPDEAAISQVRVAMSAHTDANGVTLGIVPQYMLTSIENEQAMLEISRLNTDLVRIRRDNIYRMMWEPVATAHLTDKRAWYMFGRQGDTLNVVWLNNQRRPMLAREDGFSVLSTHYRVVLDWAWMAVDYRGCYKFTNPAV